MKPPRDRYDLSGEDYEPDARRRLLKVAAQLIDKTLTVAAVGVAFAAAARGPGLLIPGYTPSGWFVLGLWALGSLAARMAIVAAVARFRAWAGVPAPE
jgi:hypothetical protein